MSIWWRLCGRVELLAGADEQVFIDIDSLLRPVYGHAKQGGSYGHTKIAGKQVLRKGLSPLATTISTPRSAPMIAGMRLRAGKTGSGKGAGRMVAQAIATARAAGATGQILVRGDSAYGTPRGGRRRAAAPASEFSLVLTKNTAVAQAIAAIPEDAWTPVRYPGAAQDPDTGAWISDAEVAEIPYTAFASTTDAVTARLIVRRVKDARYRDALFPVWRYHPFFTDSTEPVADADITHRQTRHHRNRVRRPDRRAAGTHALRPLRRELGLGAVRGHRPQPAARRGDTGRRTRTPSRAVPPCDARSSTFPPAWPAPNADPSCTCPATGPGSMHGFDCGTTPSDNTRHRWPSPPDHPPQGPTRTNRKSWADQRIPHTHTPKIKINHDRTGLTSVHPWIKA